MTFTELLDSVRQHYLERFWAETSDREGEGNSVLLETASRMADGEVAREGVLDLPMRSDIVVVNDGQITDSILVDTEKMVSFSPFDLLWADKFPIRIGPFQWNYCPVVLRNTTSPNWDALARWFLFWFDEHDRNPADAHGLYGVVHYMSDPSLSEANADFVIDLGSAPVDAFEELLDAIAQAGAQSAELGQCQ